VVAAYPGRRARRPCPGLLSGRPSGAPEGRTRGWKKKFRFKNRLLTLDSTTVELCASMFDWVHWRQTKGAIKLHLLLGHAGRGSIRNF
jgi:hypothetical protein